MLLTPEEDLKIWWEKAGGDGKKQEKAGGGYLNIFWKEDLIFKKGLVLIELHFHPLLMLYAYLKSTISIPRSSTAHSDAFAVLGRVWLVPGCPS